MSAAFGAFHRRPKRVVPAVITAGLLLVAAVVLIWSSIQRLAAGSWPGFVQQGLVRLSQIPWASATGWVLAVMCIVLGLILIVLALAPGAFASSRLTAAKAPHVRETKAFLAAEGLARLAASYVNDIDGVEDARTTVSARRLWVRVHTTLTDDRELKTSLRDSLTSRLRAAGMDPLPTIVIKTSHREIQA